MKNIENPKNTNSLNHENSIYQNAKDWIQSVDYKKRKYFMFKPKESALLVIDMQNYFLDVKSHAYLPQSKYIIQNVKLLINAYRKRKLPIIFTRHAVKNADEEGIMGKWWGGSLFDGTYFAEIYNELKPQDFETVLRKTKYSAFQKTNLEEILKKSGVKTVIITGVMTHLCCETTAREAFMKDFLVYFIVDATATVSLELHLCSLKTLSHGFAIPILTSELLEELKSAKNQ